MNLFKSVGIICMQNLRKWQSDYRVWAIAMSVLVIVWIYIDDIKRIAAGINTAMPIWIYPFLYSQFHTKIIFTLPLVLLFCNAPFIDGNQVFVFMRSGKTKWLFGQILYVVMASGIYYLFLLTVSLIGSIAAGGEINLEWGKTLITAANTNAAQYFGSFYISVASTTITYFSPLSAVWFTFLLSWLCGIMIGLIIFFCNITTGTRALGIIVTSMLVVLSVFAHKVGYPAIVYFSPISWITLEKIDIGGLTKSPTFEYCIGFYLLTIALLMIGILIFGKKQGIDVKG